MILLRFYILSSCTIQKNCDYDNLYTISLNCVFPQTLKDVLAWDLMQPMAYHFLGPNQPIIIFPWWSQLLATFLALNSLQVRSHVDC
jgi:hypothetical protein